MLGNFSYCNPTKLYFGENSLSNLSDELKKYGDNVVLVYGTWALNTLIAKGKTTDWEVHMLGQAVGGYTNATHGMTLSAVSLAYYRYIMPYGLDKFKRFAINVWNVSPQGKTDEQIAKEGLLAMENWMNEIGVITNISDLGVTKDDIENIADLTLTMDGGYKTLSRDEKIKVLSDSL